MQLSSSHMVIMLGQIVGDTSDVWAGDGNMVVHVFECGLWIVHQFGYVSFNFLSNLFFEVFELLFGSPRVFNKHMLVKHNWVTVVSHMLDLISSSVCHAWVRH